MEAGVEFQSEEHKIIGATVDNAHTCKGADSV